MSHLTIEEFCLSSSGGGSSGGIPKQEHILVRFAYEGGNPRRHRGQRADVAVVLLKESWSIVDGEAKWERVNCF